MASVAKYKNSQVMVQLIHNTRSMRYTSNTDIDVSRSDQNYSLIPGRANWKAAYTRFMQRKRQLYCYNRENVKVLAGWIVTAPKKMLKSDETRFFDSVFRFLCDRYGMQNTIQAMVHKDESGQPHLHFMFIPVVPDKKHGGEKICANDVLNRKELKAFHGDLQKWLKKDGLNVNVNSGITAKQGGNKTVKDLKAERDKLAAMSKVKVSGVKV